ncbi:MAG: hypothetical protein IPL61_03160 [Myxococcales bacterium]|nr:hypothetical protein [Myxococcales bacterium]
MVRRLALTALVVVAACDDAVDIRLIAPVGESARPVDYSCVNRIEIVPYGNLVAEAQCLPITPGTIDTLRDHHLDGLFSADLPNGFFALDIRGVRADADDCVAADTIFHGEGYYDGGWTMDVPLRHALDCRDFTTAATTAQLLDLTKLLTNGADRCAPPAAATSYAVYLQHQYPYDLGAGELDVSADRPLNVVAVAASGQATLAGPHFVGAVDASCMTLGTGAVPLGELPVTTCIDVEQPTLCGPPGAAELLTISPTMFAAFTGVRQIGAAIAVGLVWDRATRRPLAGATVTPVPGSATYGFRYFDFAAGTVSPSVATATTASGLFAIEIGAPTQIEIRAPGHTTRRVALAAGGVDVPGIQSIPM